MRFQVTSTVMLALLAREQSLQSSPSAENGCATGVLGCREEREKLCDPCMSTQAGHNMEQCIQQIAKSLAL